MLKIFKMVEVLRYHKMWNLMLVFKIILHAKLQWTQLYVKVRYYGFWNMKCTIRIKFSYIENSKDNSHWIIKDNTLHRPKINVWLYVGHNQRHNYGSIFFGRKYYKYYCKFSDQKLDQSVPICFQTPTILTRWY